MLKIQMEERTKLKLIALTSVVMYAICFVSVFLYVPIIITSIVEYLPKNFISIYIQKYYILFSLYLIKMKTQESNIWWDKSDIKSFYFEIF